MRRAGRQERQQGTTHRTTGAEQQYPAPCQRLAEVVLDIALQAFELATQPSERSRLARAANAFKFEGDAVLAENFDGVGLLRLSLIHI